MKRLIPMLLVGAALAVSADFAAAHPHRGRHFGGDGARTFQRDHGRHPGLSRSEGRRLRQRHRLTQRVVRQALRDGRLTRAERRLIAKLRQIDRRFEYRLEHNRRGRWM